MCGVTFRAPHMDLTTMPKKNQIPYFHSHTLADGSTAYHWKPSPRLRRLGWTNMKLPDGYKAAINAAMAQNEAVEASERQGARAIAVATPPRRMTFAELVRTYTASQTFKDLKANTQRQYRWSLRALEVWAEDGKSIARLIDADMVEDLKTELVKGSPHRAAALLRTLRILMGWAKLKKYIDANPCVDVSIPEPRARTKRIVIDTVRYLVAHAEAKDMHDLAMAIALGFFTFQREGDLCALTKFKYKELTDIAAEDRASLCGTDGRVMGFFLQQQKTGKWVFPSLPPEARAMVDAEMVARAAQKATSTHIFRFPGEDRECPEWKLQRMVRAGVESAIEAAREADDNWLVDQLTDFNFRDLRRSGMCWMRDCNVGIGSIAATSGHSIRYTTRILDTYMPADARGAAAGMAEAMRRQGERDLVNKEGRA